MKIVKPFYVILILICLSCIVFSITGNPFDVSLTNKQASETNNSDYDGRLTLSSVKFDRITGTYTVMFSDGDGVSAPYTYNPSENSFTDHYAIDRDSVVRSIARGKIIALLYDSRVEYDEITVEPVYATGIIEDITDISCESITVLVHSSDAYEFSGTTSQIIEALNTVKEAKLTVISPEYTVSFSAYTRPSRIQDIQARIKSTEET